MNPKPLLVIFGLTLASAPALADPTGIMLMRDSDGIVISVIHPIDFVPMVTDLLPGGIYYTFRGEVLSETGGGVMMPGVAMNDGPMVQSGGLQTAAAVAAQTVNVGGAVYQVEALNGKVWLRDTATGQRFAAQQHVVPAAADAKGLNVNPTAFALD